jgi:hypothetical protein
MKMLVRIAAVAFVATAFLLNVSAADSKAGKGPGVKIVPGENVLMTCAHCKDDYAVKVTTPSKGTAPEKAVVGTHKCEKCGSKLVIKGDGKSKELASEHTCKGCATK